MSDGFRRAHARLTDFIAQHPEIEVGDSVISIPESVRGEFYGFFNAARDALVEERFSEQLKRAALLLENYRKAEERIKGLLCLEETSMVSGLQRFLSDPKASLTRELFDPLFDLLKGREDVDGFEEKACEKIEALFPTVFRGGFEKWAVLSLAGLLEGQKAFKVDVRNLSPGERSRSAANAPLEEVPVPQESASFPFSQPRYAVFAVPDFILHSGRLKRHVGFRSEFKEGLYAAWNASPEREWCRVDTDLLIQLESGLTLVYVAERAESIALVADMARFCRPDLVFWCVDTRSVTRKEAFERMKQVHSRLKPPKGSYVVAGDSWPESCGDEPAAGIRFLTVGYDESQLSPLVDALADVGGPATAT